MITRADTAEKTCFVAMPIKREGTPEHAHFRAIYDQIIKPVVTGLGYHLLRGDDVQKAGSITKDIVLMLAYADLVIADLTDLNPNVFYELGVRHALRGKGTIIILDELRTDTIPFDLSAYRVVKFKGELTGVGRLGNALQNAIAELVESEDAHRDNPVHDWIPWLPQDAVASAKGSIEGDLRERLADAQKLIRHYEQTYGKPKERHDAEETNPLGIVLSVLTQAEEGNLPTDLLRTADLAAKDRNVREFMIALRKILERRVRLSDDDFFRLAVHSSNLGLPQVSGAIYDHALQLHPKSVSLRHSQLAHFAHSDDPGLRERARQELLQEIGIEIAGESVKIGEDFDREKRLLFGIMLDALHRDDLDAEALRITEAAVAKFPGISLLVRNHARALVNIGRSDEALEYYQRALWCRDVDDTTAIWFSSELHNRERYVDSAEVCLVACVLDPDDAGGFSNLADELAWSLQEHLKGAVRQEPARKLPDSVDVSVVELALSAALSCRRLAQRDLDRCQKAAERIEMEFDAPRPRLTLGERVAFARSLYAEFQSDLSRRPAHDAPIPLSTRQEFNPLTPNGAGSQLRTGPALNSGDPNLTGRMQEESAGESITEHDAL